MGSTESRPLPAPGYQAHVASSESSAFDRWAVHRLRAGLPGAAIRFRLWDGFEVPPPARRPVATVLIKNRRALLAWLWNPELNFGEAYMSGAIDVDGDLEEMLEEAYRAMPVPAWSPADAGASASSRGAARANVHHHYDLGNTFYRLWLDEELLYTCAYFPSQDDTLEAAQLAKMDLICRKLALKPGERVVEAGCGWGALAMFMARHYGVRVRAFNLSTEQIAYARERAAREGLASHVEFVEDDYRNAAGTYDAFVSVGMLEHVGLGDYDALGHLIASLLTEHGRGLLHFIGRTQAFPLNAWIRKRIFPGAYPPTVSQVTSQILDPRNLTVLDVENLRLHYAKTLSHWRERFERSAEHITRMFDEPFVRAWRLYLAGSQAAFATGSMQLFQILFNRGTSNAIPWIRVSR